MKARSAGMGDDGAATLPNAEDRVIGRFLDGWSLSTGEPLAWLWLPGGKKGVPLDADETAVIARIRASENGRGEARS